MTVRSAVYLSGNKYRLWEQIKPHLQDGNRKVFIDLFGGSATTTLNVVNEGLFDTVVYNDKAKHLYELQKLLQQDLETHGCKPEGGSYLVRDLIETHYSYPTDKEGYKDLVDTYNKYKSVHALYILQTRSNSNMMRFNKEGCWNMTYGERATFFPERILKHQQLIQEVDLWNLDFGDVIECLLESADLSGTTVYLDPPYHSTTAVYNENGGWTQNDNTTLLEYCVELQKRGAKVVISNVFENRGKVHQELIDWCEEYKDVFEVHHLNMDYNNSSFRKGKGKTDEVLIVSR